MVEINSIECNSIESIEHNSIDISNLNDQQFSLNKISEIKDYFIAEIKERELISKKLSKCISLCIGLVKKLLKTRNKKKKHNKIVMLARSKLNSIESKISEALINNQISHEDFITIINEERNYRELKERLRMTKGQEDKKINIEQLIYVILLFKVQKKY